MTYRTGAKSYLAITATGGDANLSSATATAGQALNINAAGTVHNNADDASAQQVAIHAAGLANRRGTISQSGTTDTVIQATGALGNTDGTITTNGHDLTLEAGSIANGSGEVQLAGNGTLIVSTGAFGTQRSSVASDGALQVGATRIDNTAGSLTSVGAASVTTPGALTNTNGRIEAGAALSVTADSADNSGCDMQSDNAPGLTVAVTGQLTNAGTSAFIGGSGNTVVSSGILTNSGTAVVKVQLSVDATGTQCNT